MRVGIASTSAPARHVVAAPARRRVTTMAAKGPFFFFCSPASLFFFRLLLPFFVSERSALLIPVLSCHRDRREEISVAPVKPREQVRSTIFFC